jgi:hypothetical protein
MLSSTTTTSNKWLEAVRTNRVKDLLKARSQKLITADHNDKLGDVMKVPSFQSHINFQLIIGWPDIAKR